MVFSVPYLIPNVLLCFTMFFYVLLCRVVRIPRVFYAPRVRVVRIPRVFYAPRVRVVRIPMIFIFPL